VARLILVPIAIGKPCSHVRRAVWLAKLSGAEIILLCVTPHDKSADYDVNNAKQIAATEASDISVRSLIVDGDPAREILSVARRENVDLIVMGVGDKWQTKWSDERVFQRFLPRSTVTRVIQQTPCPVWLDRSPHSATMGISSIFCFLDFKVRCEGLIQYAARIAKEHDTRMLLFHSTNSTRMFAPGQHPNAVQMRRDLIQMAERKIEKLQSLCSTSVAAIITYDNYVQSLNDALKGDSSPLVITDRISDRWGDNHKIFRIIRYCETSLLIRAEAKNDFVRGPSKWKLDPAIVLLASMAIGASLIYLVMYLAQHTDQCHFAAIRCQTPTDLLFAPRSEGSSSPP
jgi:nucleotide-binding universal stress UspA family protein